MSIPVFGGVSLGTVPVFSARLIGRQLVLCMCRERCLTRDRVMLSRSVMTTRECSTKTWNSTAEDFQSVVLVCAWGLVGRAAFDCFLRQLPRQGPFPLTWSVRDVGRDSWGLKDSPSPPTPTASTFSVTWKLKEVFCLLFPLLLLRNLMLFV